MKIALAVAMLMLCSVSLTQASSVGTLGYQTHEAEPSQDTTNCL
jgi:hypothetical protein